MKRTEEIEAKQEKQAAKQEKQAKEEPKKEKKAAKKKEKLEERITEQVRRLEFKGQGKKKITGEKRKSRPSVTMTEPGERKRSHSKKKQGYNQSEKCEKRSSRSRGKGTK